MSASAQNAPAVNGAHQGWSRGVDPWLLVSALVLTGLGVIMVYSASSALAGKRYLDSAYFVKHQLVHVAVGFAVMAWLATQDYQRLRKLIWPVLILVFLALVAVLIPGVGHRAGGAARWLRLGFVSVQPAELAKLAMVLFLAHWLSRHQDRIKSLFVVFLPCLGVAGLLIGPILAEPDLGTSVMIMALTAVLLFAAGNRVSYLGALALACAPGLYFLIFKVSYRLDRLTGFLNPWDDPADTGFQIIHSFLAFGSGGVMGAGLGGSRQKLFYLPEPHTDFILSVLGEELGLWGMALTLGLFMVLIWRGIRATLSARDLFGAYLALGATVVVGLQAFVNAAVVMGLLPTKGMTLPFISYGGSSILTNFACLGLMLSVARHQGRPA